MIEQGRLYWQALRPFSFPASVFPSLTGTLAAMVFHQREAGFSFSIVHAVMALIGSVAIHATSNVLNDYFDWRSGLDRPENSGRMNPLVQGIVSPTQIKLLAAVVGTVAVAIGAYFIAQCGMPIVWIVAVGAISAWAYTAPPLALKYRGIGELQVMISFGVLMTLGSYTVQAWQVMTHHAELAVVMLSLPQTLLIAAILHANNHRDRQGDSAAGVLTLSLHLGTSERSVFLGKVFVWSAFVVHGLIVLATHGEQYAIPAWTLLAWGSMPIARRALQLLPGSDNPTSPSFAAVVPAHARLQLLYGALMDVGLIIAAMTANG